MLIDNLCILLLVLFTLRGYMQGLTRTAIGLAGLVLGYAGAWLFHDEAARALLAAAPTLPPLAAQGFGGMVVLAACTLAASVVAFIVGRRMRARADAKEVLAQDQGNGAILGLVEGFLFSVVVLVALSLVPPGAAVDRYLNLSESEGVRLARTVTPGLFGALWEQATGDRTSAVLLQGVLRDPAGTREALGTMVQNEKLRELTQDQDFMSQLRSAPPATVARDPRLQALTADPELRATLLKLGFREEDLRYDPAEAARVVAHMQAAMQSVPAGGAASGAPSLPPELLQLLRSPQLQSVLSGLAPPTEPK